MCCSDLDNACNTKKIKIVCIVFKQRNRLWYILDKFPLFTLNGCKLNYASQFCYLVFTPCGRTVHGVGELSLGEVSSRRNVLWAKCP